MNIRELGREPQRNGQNDEEDNDDNEDNYANENKWKLSHVMGFVAKVVFENNADGPCLSV